MNTPAHAMVNFALLERDENARWVLAGAVLPDLPNVVFFAYHRVLLGQSAEEMYSRAFHTNAWQLVMAPFHAMPLVLLLMAMGAVRKSGAIIALALSMLLHDFADLLTHHSDAHRHLWPLSDWRWASPVSYWERAHHAAVYVPCELGVTIVASWIVWRRAPERWRLLLSVAANGWLLAAYATGLAFW